MKLQEAPYKFTLIQQAKANIFILSTPPDCSLPYEYIYKQLAYVANILRETTSFASRGVTRIPAVCTPGLSFGVRVDCLGSGLCPSRGLSRGGTLDPAGGKKIGVRGCVQQRTHKYATETPQCLTQSNFIRTTNSFE